MWIICGLLLLAFGVVFLSNMVVVYHYLISRKRNTLIPLVGGVLGAIGFLFFPLIEVRRYWLVPLIIDPGCMTLIITTAIWYGVKNNKWVK